MARRPPIPIYRMRRRLWLKPVDRSRYRRPVRPLARGRRRLPAWHATTLVVENMHCGGCMRKVETALASRTGRRERPRQPFRPARHRHPSGVSAIAADLVDALDRAGFKASAVR